MRRDMRRFFVVMSMISLVFTFRHTFKCLSCESDKGCKSKKECEKSCTRKQVVIECDAIVPLYQECVNVSYTFEEFGETVYTFVRKCEMTAFELGGCEHSCLEAYMMNSTDCDVECCIAEDNCNGDIMASPTSRRFADLSKPDTLKFVSSSTKNFGLFSSSCYVLNAILLIYLVFCT